MEVDLKKAGNETEWGEGEGEGVERKLIKRAGGKYNYIYNINMYCTSILANPAAYTVKKG
jgi:hypothetical protein